MTPALLGAIGRLGGAIAGRATCRRCPRSLWDATCDTGEEADLLSWL